MTRVILALPGNEAMAAAIAKKSGAQLGELEFRRFPDEEAYVRIKTPVEGAHVGLVCTLDRPDGKTLPLLFCAALVRDLGAAQVGLIAPYLAYMRQDRRFKPGEAVTSVEFSRLLSEAVAWIVTVDPHLHRVSKLDQLYDVPSRTLHAAALISHWIRVHVDSALLIGPDAESAQWVGAVAADAGAPHLVLEKIRHGDRDVEVSVPNVAKWRGHTPVLVDDIISTARTMIETTAALRSAKMKAPVCIGVHAVFAPGAYDALREGAARVVTTNTIAHESNTIDVSGMLADAIADL